MARRGSISSHFEESGAFIRATLVDHRILQPMLRAIFCSVEKKLQRNGQLKLISNKPSFYPSKKLDHNKTFFRQRLLGIISMTFANLCHDLILNSFIHRFCRFLCHFKTNVKLTILIFNFNPSCV